MDAALLDLPTETQETPVSCADCPALRRMEQELEALRREVRALRCEVGYWKSRHADAVKRIEGLKEELQQAQGQVRALQDKLFGRKSEKSGASDRSNELFDPEEATVGRNRQGDFHQAYETRWLVFAVLDGEKGYGWWLWVVLGVDTVVYLLDPSRGHEVPQSHLGVEASGVLEVDRYSGYKAMTPVKNGLLLLAFCWAHVRRATLAMRPTTPATINTS